MTTHGARPLDLQKSMSSTSELRAAERFFHEQIPLTRAMGLRVARNDENGFTVEAPVALNYNHLHTAFGGSINAVATLAGYGLLWLQLRDVKVDLLIAQSSIKFLRPVRETITAICKRPSPEVLDTFGGTVREAGKARITLRVSVEENGVAAAKFEATFVALTRFRR